MNKIKNSDVTPKKTNILVTGVGGSGVGEGIVKALKMDSTKYKILGTDVNPFSAALFRVDKGYIVPDASNEEYIERLISICNEEEISAVIPGSIPELKKISDDREKLEREGIQLIIGPKKVIDIGLDKWRTYEFLRAQGFSYPKTYLSKELNRAIDELDFPMFVKPRFGYGSRHTYAAQDAEELGLVIKYLEKIEVEPLIQEYVDAKECTAGVVVSKLGRILGSISILREIKFGFSYRMLITDVKDARETSEEIASKLGITGPLNVQCFVTKGKPVIFEINPRFSGSTPIRSAAGFREVDAVLRNFLFGEEIQLKFKQEVIAIRYLDELYTNVSTLNELQQKGYTRKRGWRKRCL